MGASTQDAMASPVGIDVRSDPSLEELELEKLRLDEEHTETKAVTSNGGYRYELPEEKAAMKAQRAAVWHWLRGIGMHVLRDGFSLISISMPVTLFEPRSWLERMCDNWSYLQFLELAAAETDPVARMKLLVTFSIAGLRQQISFGKPFNPILGETFQGEYDNGTKVFIEQISHHPPISSWQLYGHDDRYRYYGNGTWAASVRGNLVKGQQTGLNRVWFASDGAEVEWELPHLIVRGVLFGERTLKYGGTMRFNDAKNGLTCEVSIDGSDGPGFLRSMLRRRRPTLHDQVHGELVDRQGKVLDRLSGSWLSHLEWSGGVTVHAATLRTLWDANKTPRTHVKPLPSALQSDARFRKDLVLLKTGDLEKSQAAKVELEQLQRADRKLRAEGLKTGA